MKQLSFWFKEVEDLIGIEQSKIHHPEGDVFTHSMMVLDEAAKLKDEAENKLSFTYHFHILNDHQNNLSHFFSGVKCNAAPPFAFSFKTSLSPAFIFL